MGLLVQGGSISFDELAGFPKLSAGRDVHEASREGKISWSDINAAIVELFPPAPALPGLMPGTLTVFAEHADFEPFHPDPAVEMICTGSVATYSHCRVRVKYTTSLGDAGGGGGAHYDPSDLFSRKWSFSGEFLTLQAAGLYWEEEGIDDPEEPIGEEEISAAKIIPMTEHSLTRHRATSIPWTAIQANIGLINENAINNGYFTSVAAECLLFMGAEINFVLSTDGSKVYTYELRFQERRSKHKGNTYGWNHFWHPNGGRFRRIQNASGDNVYPFSADDFAGLFA